MYQEGLVWFAKDHPMKTGRNHRGPGNQHVTVLVGDVFMESAGSGAHTGANSGNEWLSGLIHQQHQTQLGMARYNWKDPRDFYRKCQWQLIFSFRLEKLKNIKVSHDALSFSSLLSSGLSFFLCLFPFSLPPLSLSFWNSFGCAELFI